MKKFAIVLLFVALSFGIISAQEEVDRTGWPETFIIGVYPGDNVESALASNEPLRAYLEEQLGVRTVIITGTSYNAVIEAMAAGRADAFEVGPFSYLLAADIANAEALVIGAYTTNRDLETIIPAYYSLLFTKKGSGIDSIDDLAGRSLAFTDPASTSGYLVPSTEIMLAQGFTDPTQIEEFASVTFAGSHQNSVLAVWNDTVEAGATFDENLARQVAASGVEVCGYTRLDENDEQVTYEEMPFRAAMTDEEIMAIYDACPEGSLVVFHQSPPIVQTPFAVNSNLPESFKTAVYNALIDLINHPEVVDELGRFYVDPTLIDPTLENVDAAYNPLREIATLHNLDLSAR